MGGATLHAFVPWTEAAPEMTERSSAKAACVDGPIGRYSDCVRDIGLRFDDISKCADPKLGTSVQQGCVREVAAHLQSAKGCSALAPDLADACFHGVAKNTNDGDTCAAIRATYDRARCYEDLARAGHYYCDRVKDIRPDGGGCLPAYAYQLDSPAKCLDLGSEASRCLSILATSPLMTPELCAKADGGYGRNVCAMLIANRPGQSLAVIQQMCSISSKRDECWGQSASTHKNPRICELAEPGEARGSCYQRAARDLQDAGLCQHIEVTAGSWGRDACFRDLVLILGDARLCDRMVDAEHRARCRADHARLGSGH